MKCLSARLLTALIAFLAAAGSSRADYLQWTYTSSPSVPGVAIGSGPDSASVTLTDYTNHSGATTIPVVAYLTSTNAATPVSFNGSTYGLTVTITDNNTNHHGTLSFTGTLSGGLSATSSSLENSFSASAPKTLPLDGHIYTVTIPTQSLAAPTAGQKDIVAQVSIADGQAGNVNPGSGSTGTNTPEPAGLVLAGLGFSFLGAGRWWKGRSVPR